MDELDALTEERERFKALQASIDEDLARQRFERLAEGRGKVNRKVLEAAAAGNSIAKIKRAYGTKDYKTIKTILDNGQAELDAILAGRADKTGSSDSNDRIVVEGAIVYVDGVAYDIIELDEDEYMLDVIDADASFDPSLDGEIVSEYSKGLEGDIYFAIKDSGGI